MRLIFISHSSQDTWVARQLAREIEACGGRCFLDEAEIEVGADFERDILAALERADEILLLLTPWALERPYVWLELGAAWMRRIRIVALLHGVTVEELQSRPETPLLLKNKLTLDLNRFDDYLVQLKRRV